VTDASRSGDADHSVLIVSQPPVILALLNCRYGGTPTSIS
jgi:hypothetical protein